MTMKGISLQQLQRNKKQFVTMCCRTGATILITIRLRNQVMVSNAAFFQKLVNNVLQRHKEHKA
jgi:hypothetical protein